MIDLLICWYALGWANTLMFNHYEAHKLMGCRGLTSPKNIAFLFVSAPLVFLCLVLFWIVEKLRGGL